MMRIGNPMSESREDGCYCKKCGVPVDPTDEKCRNGHVLKEVGRHFVRSAEAGIGVSAEAKIEITKEEEDLLKRMSNRIKRAIEKRGIDSITIKLPFIDITFDACS